MTEDTATCRHCGRDIERISAGWTDGQGFFACVKAPAESVGHGRPAGFVLHEPMPAGLRGASDPEVARIQRNMDLLIGLPDDPFAREG